MSITITNRWGKETKDPGKSLFDNTLSDLFLDNVLSDVSITDEAFHMDVKNNRWVYLENCGHSFYMKDLEMNEIHQLWEWFFEGKVDHILAAPWIEGVPAFNGDW